jgi:hypothetical protein
LLLVVAGAARAGGETPVAEPPGGMPPANRLEAVLADWLAAGDGRHVAWAGWIVADRRIRALGPAVRRRLERSATREGPREPSFFADAALLDALIRTGATADGATLIRLAPAHTGAVTVLLCRREAFEDMHLAVFETAREVRARKAYVALGNRMATWRAPAFVARILSDLRLRRDVQIHDDDPPYSPFRRPWDSVPGCGIFRVPPGYPPAAGWGLTFEAGDRECVSTGRRPVYAYRNVARDGEVGFGRTGMAPDAMNTYRHEWLTDLLEGADVPPLPIHATIDVKWSGGRQVWRRKTVAAVAGVHDRFRAWRDALFARGLVTEDARRALRPRVTFEVHDRRRHRKHPLPRFPADLPFDPELPVRHRLVGPEGM